MDYEKNYYDYMNYIKNKNRIYENGKYELHHILPKSLGGTDEKENLILLTYREHYLAHFLLWKIHGNNKMLYAFWLMNNVKSKVYFKINSRVYSKLKKDFAENQSKKIICLETGEIYNSLKEAASDNNLIDGWSIRIAIRNKKRVANGYHWDEYEYGIDYTKNKLYKKERKEFTVIRLEDCKKYRTLKEAGDDNNILSKSTILDAIKGRIKTANGYHWDKYDASEDYTKNKFYNKKRNDNVFGCKRVMCIETKKTYNSQTEAAKDIGYKISGDIGRCCDGKLKSCGGYHWRRYED